MHIDGRDQYALPSNGLRRRHHADRRRSQNTSDATLTGTAGLELSMHLPKRPAGNRFEALRRSSPTLRTHVDRNQNTQNGRSRYNRGSREGKRRRDARRNRRKLLATQKLDEQLSRDFTWILERANVNKSASRSAPAIPITSIAKPATCSPPVKAPDNPPQLPFLNFGGLDLMDDSLSLVPSRSPSLLPQLPARRQEPPFFLPCKAKWHDFLLFFDLSKLPEPREVRTPAPGCRELQLWRPTASIQTKKQSRFFPTIASRGPARSSSTEACKLHPTDSGPKDAATQTTSSMESTLKPAAKQTAVNLQREEHLEASAANLWRILNGTKESGQSDPCALYGNGFFAYQPYVKYSSVCPSETTGSHGRALGRHYELDNTEIPYVHANSLTGYANERAGHATELPDEDMSHFDVRQSLTPLHEFFGCLNELVVDQLEDLSIVGSECLIHDDLPPLPPSPILEPKSPMFATIVPTLNESEIHEEHLDPTTAQFESEQALFVPTTPLVNFSHAEPFDTATLLAVEHVLDCWCIDCRDAPELPPDSCGEEFDDLPELVYADNLNEDSEWEDLLSPSRSRSPSIASAWEQEWDTFGYAEEELDLAWAAHWDNSPEWSPSSVAHGPW